jgi:hypothetical protein
MHRPDVVKFERVLGLRLDHLQKDEGGYGNTVLILVRSS